jgi:iron complex transport system substrate-binding protein
MISTEPRLLLFGAFLTMVVGAAGCRTHTSGAPPSPAKASAWPRSFTDALGDSVTLAASPKRIVSLSPAITEMVFAIGAGGRLVGVTEYCDFPPEAKKLPKVGAYTGFSVERVLELRPDVVIGMRGTSKEAVTALRQAGVPTLTYDPVSVRDVLDLMDELSGMILTKGEATDAVMKLRGRVELVQKQAAGLPRRPRVLCAVQIEPLYAAGPDNHIDDMVRLAGGDNAAGDADIPWPQYSLERMLQKDPEVILVPYGYMGDKRGAALKTLRASEAWSRTTAVKHGSVIETDDDLITLPGPRIVDGLERIAAAVRRAATLKAG